MISRYSSTIGFYSCVLCSIVSQVIEFKCVLVHYVITRGDILYHGIHYIILTMIHKRVMSFHTVLWYMRYCIILYCNIILSSTMYYTILLHIVFHSIDLNWIALDCSMLQCTRLWLYTLENTVSRICSQRLIHANRNSQRLIEADRGSHRLTLSSVTWFISHHIIICYDI